MRELPRDLVLILRTEAKNQRTPPIDYVIAEDGGRMVHRPEPDIAMAELLEEAAAALASERAAHVETRRALDGVIEACNHTEAQALGLAVDLKTTEAALEAAIRAAPAAEPVSVKPLEWVEDHGVSGMGPYRLFYAVTPLGRFVYGTDAMGDAYWHPPSSGVYTAGSEESAKRAAERSWEKYALAEAGKFLRLAAAPTEAEQ